MYPRFSFLLLQAICNNDLSLVIKLCKEKFDHSASLNPLSLALHTTPVNPQIVQTLLEYGFKPSPQEVTLLQKLALPKLTQNSMSPRSQSQVCLLDSNELLTLFEIAEQRGDVNLSQYLYTQANCYEELILTAASLGHLESVRKLLEDPRVNLAAANNEALISAADHGHKEVVELLLKDPRVDPASGGLYSLYSFLASNAAFILAAENGHKEIVELLLKDTRVEPFAENNQAFISAACNGHKEVVELLLKDTRVGPFAENNQAFILAASNGHKEVVELLLKDLRVDPTAKNNRAFILAAENGHKEVVELLLKDARVDPFAENNQAFISAACNGHKEIVELLLKELQVDPAVEHNHAFILAAGNGHKEVAELLLKELQIDPAAENNQAFIFAARNGHKEVVELLLKDPRVDPTAANHKSLIQAVGKGHIEIVKILLGDSRINPAANNNEAILKASQNGSLNIVKSLLKNPRVMHAINPFKMAEIAIKDRKDIKLLRILLEAKAIDLHIDTEYVFSLAWKEKKESIITFLLAFTPIDKQAEFLQLTKAKFPHFSAYLTQEVNWLHSLFLTESNDLPHKAFTILKATTGIALSEPIYIHCAKHLYSSPNQQTFSERLISIGLGNHLCNHLHTTFLNIAKTFYPLLATSKTILDHQHYSEIPSIFLIASTLFPQVPAPLLTKFLKTFQQHLLPSLEGTNTKEAFNMFTKAQVKEAFDTLISNLYQSKNLSNHWVGTIKASSTSSKSPSM